MRFITKLGLLGLYAGVLVFLAGCAASPTHSETSGVPATQAVYCDGCKVTWVRVPAGRSRGQTWGYQTTKHMECPNCRDAVSNFFATGKLAHSCSACGGNMSICDAH
jgi:hypothetical protein